MSKYYKAEEVQILINSLKCYGIPELNLDGLPTIEVSEDAISREYLIKALDNLDWYDFDMFYKVVENAPPVVSQPKEGEWYRQTTDHFDYWECSECGMGVGLDDIKNYCPNCGSKMKGAER